MGAGAAHPALIPQAVAGSSHPKVPGVSTVRNLINALDDRAVLALTTTSAAVPIMRTYGLEDVPRGPADFAAGTRGKLAVRIHND